MTDSSKKEKKKKKAKSKKELSAIALRAVEQRRINYPDWGIKKRETEQAKKDKLARVTDKETPEEVVA